MTTPIDRRRGARGLTLIELMVAVVVSAVVVAGAFALLTAQQRAFRSGGDERQLQESARLAMEEITGRLRMAGYGVDPSLAFDFGALTAFPMPQSAAAGGAGSTTNYQCSNKVTCRDHIDGPDEIAFRMRDPGFGHYFTAAPTSSTITINGPLPQGLAVGQVLQVICQSGAMTWAYVTVGQPVAPVTTATSVPISLQTGDGIKYGLQNGFIDTSPGSCFNATAPVGVTTQSVLDLAVKVLKVDLYRYHVSVINGRPYLMLDQGLGADSVIAPDIEDLQFVYLFPDAPTGLQRAGDVSGTQLGDTATGIDLEAAAVPNFSTSSDDASRQTHYPANIRGLQVSVVARAPSVAADGGTDTIPAAGNRPALTGQPVYRRILLESSVPTRNLDARGPVYPVWSLATTDTLNKGGG